MEKKDTLSNEYYESVDEQIDLKQTFYFLYKKRKLIVFLSFLGTFIAAILSLIETPVYKGKFEIILKSDDGASIIGKNNSATSISSFIQGSINTNLNTQVEILKSPLVLKPVFEYVNKIKSKNNNYQLNKNYSSWINSKLKVELIPGTTILKVEYKDADKDLILNTLKLISKRYELFSKRDKTKNFISGEKFLLDQIKIKEKEKYIAVDELNNFVVKNNLGILVFNGFYLPNSEMDRNINLPNSNDVLSINPKSISDEASDLVEQNNILQDFENKYLDLSFKLKPESRTLRMLKEKIEFSKKSMERPNKILVDYKNLQNNYLSIERLLFKLQDDLAILRLQKAKQLDPWELISKPKVFDLRESPKRTRQTLVGFLISTTFGIIFVLLKRRFEGEIYDLNLLKKLFPYNYLDTLFSTNSNLNTSKLEKQISKDNLAKYSESSHIFLGKKTDKNKHIFDYLNELKIKEINHQKIENKTNQHNIVLILEKDNITRNDVFLLKEFLSSTSCNIYGWYFLDSNTSFS